MFYFCEKHHWNFDRGCFESVDWLGNMELFLPLLFFLKSFPLSSFSHTLSSFSVGISYKLFSSSMSVNLFTVEDAHIYIFKTLDHQLFSPTLVLKHLSINVGDLGLIPASGRFPGEGNGNHSSTLA